MSKAPKQQYPNCGYWKYKETYIMENIAQAFRHESNIWSFTPDEEIEPNVKKL